MGSRKRLGAPKSTGSKTGQLKSSLRNISAQIVIWLYDFSMLLRFHCENFRSIRERQEISLVAANNRSEKDDPRLIPTTLKDVSGLRCAGIYGPNGSGKSNLLNAMAEFSVMIAASQKRWDSTDGIPTWDPFMLDDESRNGETEFEASFLLDEVEYRYGFRFKQSEITREWLFDYTPKERTLFLRKTEGGEVKVEFKGRNLTGSTLETIRQLTRPNSLFLSAAAQNNYERLVTIHKWFVQRFNVISGQDATRMLPFTANLCKDVVAMEKVKKLLSFADLGIIDCEAVDEEAPEDFRKFYSAMIRAAREVEPRVFERMTENEKLVRSDIRMTHRGKNGKLYMLDSDHESRGTLAYFSVLGPLLGELGDGSVLLIDELESSMHPHLVRQLVRMFNDPGVNPKGAQFIFATHSTGILDPAILRRDQIWLTEKNEEGATVIYPLTDFKPRKNQDIETAYLNGRFGAIPYFDEQLLQSAFPSQAAAKGCAE